MAQPIVVSPLPRHRELVPLLASWFVQEWSSWYGPSGQGDAIADLTAFAVSEISLPIGLVAFLGATPVGVGALKNESNPTHKHLSPWAAASLVLPTHRGHGVGTELVACLVRLAACLGYPHVHCATSTAITLLRRSGWSE